MNWELNKSSSYHEINWLLTDFLGLGVDREEVGMLDLFLKNILNVAESKFSTAKHLHDVWRAVEMHINWLASMVTWKDGLSNKTGAFKEAPSCIVVKCKIPEWDRQLQGSVYWSVSVFASAAPSGQSLSLRFPGNDSAAQLLLVMQFWQCTCGQ